MLSLNKIGTVYTVRRSNVLIATYFSKDKYAGVRVLNPAPDEDRYYAVTKYCHNESVVTFPDVSLSLLSDKCRRSLAMGKASLIIQVRESSWPMLRSSPIRTW